MGQTCVGRMESFIFLYIWNQKCSFQYPVLHNYYTAWFSSVRFFFFSQVWQNYLFPWSISINSVWGKYVFCIQTVMSLWNHYLASDIKWLTMFFLKREDFSQSSKGEALRWEMTEKRPRVLKNIFNYFIAILYS